MEIGIVITGSRSARRRLKTTGFVFVVCFKCVQMYKFETDLKCSILPHYHFQSLRDNFYRGREFCYDAAEHG